MKSILLLALTCGIAFPTCLGAQQADVSQYDVVWDSPSKDAVGSMPLCGGNLGLNVWVEGNDLLFYIGHPDSRIENGKLVKLGRVRLTLSPSPFTHKFRQELDLAESCIRITGEKVAIKLWVDALQPVVHVEIRAGTPLTAAVAYESWRFTAHAVPDGLEWFYRLDPTKDERRAKLRAQHVEAIAADIPDPLKNLTMGGRLVAAGLVADGTGEGVYMRTPFKSWKAKTARPVKSLDLRVLARVAQDDSVEAWRGALDGLAREPSERQRTIAWWREFWNRSWIDINPGESDRNSESSKPHSPAWQVGRNYQLFRYLLAANRSGKAPTLFNGGFFTFDNPLANATAFDAAGPNPDERAWWGCMFMAQNQRLVYWPLLKAGDFDMLDVGLNFYRTRAAGARAKAKHFLGVEGTLFPESLDIYGLLAACPSANGLESCGHLTYHFTSGLEFAFMMLQECRYTGRGVQQSLPVMLGMLKFYDSLYQKECQKRTGKPLDSKGRLVIQPGNSCEMGVGCTNHTDAISGLRAITEGLLQLPAEAIPAPDRAWLASFVQRIPEIPVVEKSGHKVIALAEKWQSIANPNEFPQMYSVFPFGIYGVGRPGLELARDTWRYGAFDARCQKEALCWKYGNIATAGLGLAGEAQSYCLKKFLYPLAADGGTAHYGNCAPFRARFPAFWVTYPFDAFPDMDHGGCAMIGLQEMLLQTPGDRLLLLPAWPKDWDVRFKLHAPRQTTVEGEVRGGQIVKLTVVPESRRKDVEIMGPVAPLPVPVSQGKAATASSVWHNPGYDAAKAVDGDFDTRWSAAANTRSGWLEIDLGQERSVRRAVIDESSYAWTQRFEVQAEVRGRWQTVAAGGTLGTAKEVPFAAPVRARRFRLNILEATNVPTINEFQLFE